MAWSIEYYIKSNGVEPVSEFINRLPEKHQVRVFWIFARLEELGISLPMPHARPLCDGLRELRIQVEGDIYRSIYFHWKGETFVLLHMFKKKTQTTPDRDLKIARDRRQDWLARHGGKP